MQTLLALPTSAKINPELKAQAARRYDELINSKLASLQRRALFLERQNQIDAARFIFMQANKIAPTNSSVVLAHIGFLLRHNLKEQALQVEQNFIAASIDPDSAKRILAVARETVTGIGQ